MEEVYLPITQKGLKERLEDIIDSRYFEYDRMLCRKWEIRDEIEKRYREAMEEYRRYILAESLKKGYITIDKIFMDLPITLAIPLYLTVEAYAAEKNDPLHLTAKELLELYETMVRRLPEKEKYKYTNKDLASLCSEIADKLAEDPSNWIKAYTALLYIRLREKSGHLPIEIVDYHLKLLKNIPTYISREDTLG